MALYYHLQVYRTTEMLLLEVVKQTHNVSREHRFTICQDLKQTLTELLVQIYRINRTTNKVPLMEQGREMVIRVTIYLRLLSELKAISAGQYALLVDLADSVGKQMAAWEKSQTGAPRQ